MIHMDKIPKQHQCNGLIKLITKIWRLDLLSSRSLNSSWILNNRKNTFWLPCQRENFKKKSIIFPYQVLIKDVSQNLSTSESFSLLLNLRIYLKKYVQMPQNGFSRFRTKQYILPSDFVKIFRLFLLKGNGVIQ